MFEGPGKISSFKNNLMTIIVVYTSGSSGSEHLILTNNLWLWVTHCNQYNQIKKKKQATKHRNYIVLTTP